MPTKNKQNLGKTHTHTHTHSKEPFPLFDLPHNPCGRLTHMGRLLIILNPKCKAKNGFQKTIIKWVLWFLIVLYCIVWVMEDG
jgi:hypothetical protein